MTDLKNLMIWYSYNEAGEISSISRITAIEPDADLDAYWHDFMNAPNFKGGGIEKVVKEHIAVPEHLQKVDGVAYVLYAYGKRFRAVLPYFVVVKKEW